VSPAVHKPDIAGSLGFGGVVAGSDTRVGSAAGPATVMSRSSWWGVRLMGRTGMQAVLKWPVRCPCVMQC
jgi:hypothetical protein